MVAILSVWLKQTKFFLYMTFSAQMYLQLLLRQWCAGNVYLLALSS